MDTQIIKQLLSRDFYETNKTKLANSLFDGEIYELYEVITDAHKRYDTDLTLDAVYALWQDANPVVTRATKQLMADIIKQIGHEDTLAPDIAADLLTGLWRRDTGKKIANIGLELAEGRDDAFTRLEKLLNRVKEGFMPDDFGEDTTHDLMTLLDMSSDEHRFRFNIPTLMRKVYGIGRGEFMVVFARPETGKSGFGVSLSCAPGGFCEQGRTVLYLGNEEATEKTMLRCYQAWTGMTSQEITANPASAIETFEMISDKLIMKNILDWDITRVEAFIKHKKPDVVIIDQGDKVKVAGNYDAPHLRLRELYTQLREVAKRQEVALIAVSQASADAEGKATLTMDMMEGSKTGKAAEADLVVGIGKYADNNDGSDNPIRFLNVCKNKLSGWHGQLPCKLEAPISRYVD